MNDVEVVAAYLDQLASELKADLPAEDEFTNAFYRAEMKKRGINLTFNVAARIMNEYVTNGKWTVRVGRDSTGSRVKIYRPVKG